MSEPTTPPPSQPAQSMQPSENTSATGRGHGWTIISAFLFWVDGLFNRKLGPRNTKAVASSATATSSAPAESASKRPIILLVIAVALAGAYFFLTSSPTTYTVTTSDGYTFKVPEPNLTQEQIDEIGKDRR